MREERDTHGESARQTDREKERERGVRGEREREREREREVGGRGTCLFRLFDVSFFHEHVQSAPKVPLRTAKRKKEKKHVNMVPNASYCAYIFVW